MDDIDLIDEGDDFILKVTAKDDSITEIRLSEKQTMKLSQSAQNVLARIASRYKPKGAEAEAIVVTEVAQIRVRPDKLGVAVLLTLASSTGARMEFALPLDIAKLLYQELIKAIAQLVKLKPKMQ